VKDDLSLLIEFFMMKLNTDAHKPQVRGNYRENARGVKRHVADVLRTKRSI